MNFEECAYCHRPAEYLCDMPLKGKDGFFLPGPVTCDKPLCEHHRFNDGVIIFFCGKHSGVEYGHDYCYEHGIEKGFEPVNLKRQKEEWPENQET